MPGYAALALRRLPAFLLLLLALSPALRAEEAAKAQPATPPAHLLPGDSVTHHEWHGEHGVIGYTATAGTLPLRNEKGETQADIFYVAFMRDDTAAPSQRPITYAFNGGPGAAAAYLDIGALGPRALDFGSTGAIPPAVDHVVDNPDSWLSFTDLVFIDPVGTGYSRATSGTEDAAKKFWSVKPDLDALAQIIRLHATRANRLTSPIYLAGESYGGFRAARLAQQLAESEGISPAGVLLISPVIEFRLMSGDALYLLPWALHLPSYAAVALETHGTLTPAALHDAEAFALGDYLVVLAAGSGDAAASHHLYDTVAHFTGLPEPLVERWNGRVPVSAFVKEFRRPQGQLMSRYDGSYGGADPDPRSLTPDDDPILNASIAPFTQAFVAYARDELGFKTDITYELLNSQVSRSWDWHDGESGGRHSLGASAALGRALALQPKLHVLIAHGLTDLTTPYMMSRYVAEHLPNDGTKERIQLKLYSGGHMMYLRDGSRHQLHDDAQAFYGAGGE